MPRCRSSARVSVWVLPSSTLPMWSMTTGGEEKPLGQGGLTSVYMRQNSQVQRSHEASCPLQKYELWT
jgi:hypothetical protein